MKSLLYLTGPPGAGKTTAMAALTAGCDRVWRPKPVGHELLLDRDGTPVAAELGRWRSAFGGTDALPMDVSPKACAWVEHPSCPPLLLGEGDRLGHTGFLMAARSAGYTVTLGYLTAPPHLLDERCANRGSSQSPSWRTGRATKAFRLVYAAEKLDGMTVVTIDTAVTGPAAAAALLREAVPELEKLPEGVLA